MLRTNRAQEDRDFSLAYDLYVLQHRFRVWLRSIPWAFWRRARPTSHAPNQENEEHGREGQAGAEAEVIPS